MLSSHLRTITRRVVLRTAAIARPAVTKTAIKSVPVAYRTYATNEKQVAYTVDKFPGYVRNDNFKKVNKKRHTLQARIAYSFKIMR